MKIIKICLLILILSCINLEAVTVPEIQNKMADSSSKIDSIRCRYIHEVRSALTQEKTSATGTAYFKKPNHFRIEQSAPEEQVIVTSGKYLYIYTPRFHQVIRDLRESWLKNNFFFRALSSIQVSVAELNKEYEWQIKGNSILNGEETIQIFLFKKNSSEKDQDSIMLWISGTDYLPRKSELKNGTLTVSTELLSMEKNLLIPKEIFEFKKPLKSKIIQLN